MKHILAIDQGTTGSRAIVYDRRGRKVAAAYQEFRQYFPKPGWVEHDPREIWRSVYLSIQRVLARVPGSSIAAVGITNQRETSFLWERSTGRPVCRAIVWQCRRTAARCEALKRRRELVRYVRACTGLPIDAYFSATKLSWMLEHEPRVAAAAAGGRLAFGTADSWVLWNLTGGAVHATDLTNASRTMLFDIARRDWDSRLLKEFGIPPSLLPWALPSSGSFGMTVRLGRLPAGIPITGIAGDQQAALFGQACFSPGEVKNTYGTGSFILMNTGARKTDSRFGLITTLACDAQGAPCYALEGSVFIAGAAIQWLRDGLKLLAAAQDSQRMAESVRDTGGVYLVPAFVGLGAPYWDQQARGVICGITRGTTREHLVRAALESICYQTRDVLEAMQKDSGLKIRSLKVDGGAAANDFLCRFQADMLGIPVVRPKVIEITSLGAAYLAGLGVGFWKSAEDIRRNWCRDKEFRPGIRKPEAQRLYAGWGGAVARARLR